jgi:NADH-quinone oxidoreductase subunit G
MSNSYHFPVLPGPDTPKVTINVDDVDVQVPEGTNLIEAMKTIGIDTPHFCYHPDLPLAGNCRQCMIETDGPRGMGLAIACYTPVRAGMKVATDRSSEKVRSARAAVMEFQLANHPLDCPICDKAGECTLQENYMQADRKESRLSEEFGKAYHGNPEHRFVDSKGQDRGGKHVDLGPTVVLDEERCILCDRCTRFMRDVAGSEQLYIADRGDRAYISVFPGTQLDHPYDLNVTDICPVGALTAKHFRFKSRVWFLKRTESIVPDDSLGANITIDHSEGKAWRLMPRRNAAVNRSWLSNASRLSYRALAENRLVRGHADGHDIGLEDAFAKAGQILSKGRKVALVASGHLTNEDNAGLLALAAHLGDKAEVFAGSWLAVGTPDGIARSGDPVANRKGLEILGLKDNLDELARRASEFDVLLVAHNDLWGAAPEKARALEAIAQRIVLSPWADATVAKATLSLGIRAWAEVRGTMVNCNGRIQLMQAAPIAPDERLEPAWQLLSRLAGERWSSEIDAWKACQARVPAFAALTYRTIGRQGQALEVAA